MRKRLPIQFIFVIAILSCCIQQSKAQTENDQQYVDSLINLFPKEKNDSVKGLIAVSITLEKLGEAQNNGNWDAAIEWAHKALFYSKKGNFKKGFRRSNWALGLCWKMKGNYPEAIRYFTEVLKAALNDNTPKPTVVAYTWIGDCYFLLGNYQEALKNFQSGIKICQERPSEVYDVESVQARLNLKTGETYTKLNEYPKAINVYKKSLVDDPTDSLGNIHASLAIAQIGMKNYDEALNNLQIAVQRYPSLLNLKPDIEFRGILGSFLLQIGEGYCKIGSIQKGTERNHSYNEAIKYLGKSVPLLSAGAGGKEALMNAYALLKEAYEAINDYQNALHYTNMYTHLKDSMYNKTTYLKLADQQTKFETEKAEAEMMSRQELEKTRNEKLLADQKLEQEKLLGEERVVHEKEIAEQKLKEEKAIAEEKAKSEKLLTQEKTKQEKIKAEKQQMNNFLLMGLILVVITSVFFFLYNRQNQQKKRAIEKADALHKMAELELQSLRSQLNPHFMFNSLNSIQTLILKEDSERSHSYLSNFARLLRMLLENAEKPFIPLKKEIEFLQLYLGLENLRVPDLQYSISVDPGIDIEQLLIPNMILQPYVENSIWHGLSYKDSDKQLQIRINRGNGTLKYEIEDNGVGRSRAAELKSLFRKQHESKGMALLNKRFKLLNDEYSSEIQTEIADVIKNDEVAGTLVTIKTPVKLALS